MTSPTEIETLVRTLSEMLPVRFTPLRNRVAGQKTYTRARCPLSGHELTLPKSLEIFAASILPDINHLYTYSQRPSLGPVNP